MFRSTLKSPAAQYKPPVWNKRCATPSIEPDAQRVWRWSLTDPSGVRTVVKFELLADLDTEPEGATR